MKTLVVAEKPSVGRDIARVLGVTGRGTGCLTGKDYTVTWAVGHLVSLKEPGEVDERYRQWSMACLPMLPEKIPLQVLQFHPWNSSFPAARFRHRFRGLWCGS